MKGYAAALKRVVLSGSGCWIWTGNRKRDGYGLLRRAAVRVSPVLVHRYFYEMLMGPIPAGFHLHHICRKTSCVNPRHMEPVPAAIHARKHRGAA